MTEIARFGSPDAEQIARDRAVQSVIVVEGLANTIILTVKLLVGFTTGSLAILGDAVHSFSDLANNIVVWFVIKLSASPPDREHPYGHRKFETVAVFALAALLSVIGIELGLRAIQRGPVEIDDSSTGLALMLGVLAINMAVAWWERKRARELKSDILHADASHTYADVLTTIVVIVGWQLSAQGYYWLDTICALGVAALIIYLAISLFRRVLPILVDEYAIDPRALSSNVNTVPGVKSVRRMRSRWLGSSRAVDMVVTVDPCLLYTSPSPRDPE